MKRLSVSIVLLLVLLPVSATAQSGSNIKVAPASSKINAQPGSTQRVKISLQNPTNKPITVKVSPRDFQASQELNGEPQLLPSNTSAYSLVNWLTDSNIQKQITIPANQSIEYEAVFRVPFGLSPRTHFGSVLFTGLDASISVGSLVFITIGNPETKHAIDELTFEASDDATKPFGLFTAIVSNNSEGLISPTFKLRITDVQGKKIAEVEDTTSGSTLPQSKRKYTFSPTQALPEQQLTATLTTTDQNGVSSDKSLQLDFSEPKTTAQVEQQVDPTDYTRWLITALLALSAVFTTVYIVVRKNSKTKNTPA